MNSSEFDADPKEEVDYAQLQEERRRKRGGRRRELDKKLKESLTSSIVMEKKEVDLHKGPNSLERTIMRPDYGDTSVGSSEFDAGPKEEVDYAQLQEERRRKRGGRRRELDKKLKESLTSSIVTEMKEVDLHKGPNSLERTIMRPDYGDTSVGSSEFDADPKEEVDYAQLQEERRRKRGGRRRELDKKLKESLTKSGQQTKAIVSSGAIEREQFLSIKVASNDAVKLQVELETYIEEGFDVETRPSEEGEGGSVVSQRRSRGQRRENSQQEIVETSSPDTFAHEVESLLELVKGSNKTRIDVLDALLKAKGHREEALKILLGFD